MGGTNGGHAAFVTGAPQRGKVYGLAITRRQEKLRSTRRAPRQGQQIKQGGFARTGGADQRHGLTTRDRKCLDGQFKAKRTTWSLMADDHILQQQGRCGSVHARLQGSASNGTGYIASPGLRPPSKLTQSDGWRLNSS